MEKSISHVMHSKIIPIEITITVTIECFIIALFTVISLFFEVYYGKLIIITIINSFIPFQFNIHVAYVNT